MRTLAKAGAAFLLVVQAIAGTAAENQPTVSGGYEETYPVLEIGAFTYTNVTITTKAKDYIFLHHAGGMANLKTKDLPDEVLVQLGYGLPDRRTQGQKAADWAKKSLAKVETTQVKEIEKQVHQKLAPTLGKLAPAGAPMNLDQLKQRINLPMAIGILAGFFFFYLFLCFCFSQICSKAGKPGGVLVWLPFLQMIPLLRAARMSGWWFLANFIPILNIIMSVTWCFKIAEARGKNAFIGFLLLLPVTNIVALMVLAFADSKPEKKQASGKIDLLVLETA